YLPPPSTLLANIHHIEINALELSRQFRSRELLARLFLTAFTKLLPQIVVLQYFNDHPGILPSPSAYKAGDFVFNYLSLCVGFLSSRGRNRHHRNSISHRFGDDDSIALSYSGPMSEHIQLTIEVS